ncbi:MAG: flagellar hook-associated protein FlgK [Syntrophales bacterium]
MSDINQILQTARMAILSELSAINTSGSNIANVNTPGYSRVLPIFATQGSVSAQSNRDQAGVQIAGLERIYDKYLENQIVEQQSNIGYEDVRKEALDRIETFLNESSTDGLSAMLDKFWGAWNDLAANPSGSAERNALVTVSQSLAAMFQQDAGQLLQVQKDADTSIASALDQINGYAATIAEYNQQITALEVNGGTANTVRDNRDELLKKISELVNVQTVEESNGQLNVYLSNGKPLVMGSSSYNLTTQANPDNSNYADIVFDYDRSDVLNDFITGGKVGGYLDIRDVTSVEYFSYLDAVAANLVNKVNSQHRLGFDSYKNLGGDFFVPATKAKDMEISSAIVNDPSKIAASATVNGDGDNARTLSAVKNDYMYAKVDSITPSGAGSATASINTQASAYKSTLNPIVLTRGATAADWAVTDDGGYTGLSVVSADAGRVILSLDGSGGSDLTLYLSGAWNNADTLSLVLTPDDRTATLNGYFDSLVVKVGQDVSDSGRNQTRNKAINDQLATQREAISGVSIDEEMLNLMRYQMAYNAAGKLCTVLQEMVTTLLNLGNAGATF